MTLWIMKTLHHWFGVTFAAFFFVIALSGVWVTLDKSIWHGFSYAEFRDTVHVFDSASELQVIDNVLGAFSDASVAELDFPKKGRAVFTVSLENGEQLYLHQETLEPLGYVPSRYQNGWAVRVHKNLLNLGGIGHEIVIWTGLIGTFLAVLGVMIFIPQWRGFRKDRVLFPHKLTFRDVRRSHMSSGVVFAVFVTFFSLTGWAIGEPEEAGVILRSFDSAPVPSQEPSAVVVGDVADMVVTSAALLPGQNLTHLDLRGAKSGEVIVRLSAQGVGGASEIRFNPISGQVTEILDGTQMGAGAKLSQHLPSLHSGDGHSLFYKIMLCILGLIIASLSMTGLLSYILKWRMKTLKTLNGRRTTDASAAGDE